MAEVKFVVSLLCRVLRLVNSIDVKPEHLRLAKFNTERQDVKVSLELLGRVLQMQNRSRLTEVAAVREHTAAQERTTLLAVGTDCAQSSRQLLLVLGHLVTSRSLDQLVLRKISTLLSGMELPVTEEQKSAYGCVVEQIVREQEDQCNHALWLAGRIHHAANHLTELSKVQEGNWMQLSETEFMLRRRPDMVPEYLKKVAAAGELLEAYKNWKKHAHLFTSWMESVPGWKGAVR